MSPETTNTSVMYYEEITELTLGLPGESRGGKYKSNKLDTNGKLKTTAVLVGWPPVKEHRKSVISRGGGKYVKVAVDGVPYLRKIDLQNYDSYEELLSALKDLFGCFISVCNGLNEKKLMDCVNGAIEYVPTYQDKDGDWMLLGDVPWNMFAQSCKRLRLMTRTPSTC